ncbi:MAG: twitching motility protein PilT [Lachnospiraceae bacterium]|nr:twitching motility protein PilT [Lachnospiraceae bacterium]
MVQIIAGNKGKGKTKYLLDMANTAVKEAKGSIVYLDKSAKHMYELSNKIRLINVAEFPVHTAEAFVGFLCGIISQDHDLEVMYLDSFIKLASLEGEDLTATLAELDQISAKYHVNFVLSVSKDKEELPEIAKDMILVAL